VSAAVTASLVDTGSWLDGRPVAQPAGDEWALLQRAWSYGDGLFETIAVVDGRPRLLALHLDRLREGCRRLAIALDEHRLQVDIALALTGFDTGVLRIVIARAGFERGYRISAERSSHRLLQRFSSGHVADSAPAVLHLCRQRLGRQPALAGLKHLNRLEQVLARAEWSDTGIADGLMLDTAGLVVETVVGNVFAVRDGHILTPRLDQCGVAGVMRRVVMERLGIDVEEVQLTLDDLYAAQELFMTSSTRGIRAIVQLGCVHWPVGAVTMQLQQWLQDFLARESR
jgi:4-amino-4-deoxychorismate lyase